MWLRVSLCALCQWLGGLPTVHTQSTSSLIEQNSTQLLSIRYLVKARWGAWSGTGEVDLFGVRFELFSADHEPPRLNFRLSVKISGDVRAECHLVTG